MPQPEATIIKNSADLLRVVLPSRIKAGQYIVITNNGPRDLIVEQPASQYILAPRRTVRLKAQTTNGVFYLIAALIFSLAAVVIAAPYIRTLVGAVFNWYMGNPS